MKKAVSLFLSLLIYLLLFPFLSFIYRDNYIQLGYDILVTQDDVLQTFYTTQDDTPYSEAQSVKKTISGIPDRFQTVVFDLPVFNIYNLRLDLGTTPGAEIILKNVTISKGTTKLDITSCLKDFTTNQCEISFQGDTLVIACLGNDAYLKGTNIFGDSLNDQSINRPAAFIFGTFFILLISALIYPLAQYFCKNNTQLKQLPLVIGFVIIIGIPFIVRDKFDEDKENRTESQKPNLVDADGNINLSYPEEYQQWFDDHFGLRNLLSDRYANLAYQIFNISTTNDVVIGKEGWLFYGVASSNNIVGDYQQIELYTDEQLATMKNNIETVHITLKDNNINYVLVVAPNKSSIYEEYYPSSIHKAHEIMKLDQFMNYMSDNSDVPVVDLREVLLENKNDRDLYFQADTHWNNLGAYWGYTAIMDQVSIFYPKLKAIPLDAYTVTEIPQAVGDLLFIGNINANRYRGKIFNYYFEGNTFYQVDETTDIEQRTSISDDTLPSAICYHDSFGNRLRPFLSNHFSRIRYLHLGMQLPNHLDSIIEQQPDIVLHELVERSLDLWL